MATKTSDHKVSDQVADKAHETVDRVAERAGRAEERVREQFSEADEKVREKARQGQERADDILNAVGTYVRENPLTAIGLAFVAGALYSSLTRRR